jgi:hypothetical protein
MFLNQFSAQSNLAAEKVVGMPKLSGINAFSAGGERERLGNVLRRLIICRVTAVRTARAALLGAGAQRFIDNGLDGARASAAFGAAAEATVNLLCISRQVRSCTHGISDIVVAQDVAGTDDHETGRALG